MEEIRWSFGWRRNQWTNRRSAREHAGKLSKIAASWFVMFYSKIAAPTTDAQCIPRSKVAIASDSCQSIPPLCHPHVFVRRYQGRREKVVSSFCVLSFREFFERDSLFDWLLRPCNNAEMPEENEYRSDPIVIFWCFHSFVVVVFPCFCFWCCQCQSQ